ncbi:MAG TPA: amidohydrolase family protein [Bryobacteraceae bacterium]|jgi:2,3-dihydroxybenzoate decarboxylase|nr:amidohydrolase family protein [Bryobacteraceae bacterium]
MEKIALEEHFRVPNMPEYSGAGQYISDNAAAKYMDDRLADFDELRLQAMDEANVTRAILSHTVPGLGATTDKKKAVSDAPKINDFLAERIALHPKRFGGFATLPMQSASDAAKELERCVEQLGFQGALINGHTHGHYLDEDRYEVFWERVADLDVPIYIHPTLAWQTPQNYQDHPELGAAIWGWAPETGTHILRLLFSGLFDRFPTLQIIAGHGGESLPYFLWRFDSRFKIFNFGKTLKKQPSAYIRENVAITTAGLCSTPPLRCALEELGEDRVLFSIDYPYESSKEAGDWLDNAGLATDTLRKVASGNAKRLLHLR